MTTPEQRYIDNITMLRVLLDQMPTSLDAATAAQHLTAAEDIENAADRLRYAVEQFAARHAAAPPPSKLPIFGELPVVAIDRPDVVKEALATLYEQGGGTLIVPDGFGADINTQTVARDWEGRHLRVVGLSHNDTGNRTLIVDPGHNHSAITFNSTGGTLMIEGLQVDGWVRPVLSNSGRWQRLIVKDCTILGGTQTLGLWPANLPLDRSLREVWLVNSTWGRATGAAGVGHGIYIEGRDIAAYAINSTFGDVMPGNEALKLVCGLAIVSGCTITDRFEDSGTDRPGAPVMKIMQAAFSLVHSNNITIHRDSSAQTAVPIGSRRRSMHGCWLPPYVQFTINGGRDPIYQIPEGETRGFGADPRFWDTLKSVNLDDPNNPFAFRHHIINNQIRFIGAPEMQRKNITRLVPTTPQRLNFLVPGAQNRAHVLFSNNNEIIGHGGVIGDKLFSGLSKWFHEISNDSIPDMPILPGEVPWAKSDPFGNEFARLFLPPEILAMSGQRSPIAVVPDWLASDVVYQPEFR